MFRLLAITAALALAFTGFDTAPAQAGEQRYHSRGLSEHPKAGYYRGRPEVRGFRRGVGGYSYSYPDAEIDYRDRALLDPSLADPSDSFGPFDFGGFFDSGSTGPINHSPYLNRRAFGWRGRISGFARR